MVRRGLRAQVGNIASLLGRIIGEWHKALEGGGCNVRGGVRDAGWCWTGLHRGWRGIRCGWMEASSGVLDAFTILLG